MVLIKSISTVHVLKKRKSLAKKKRKAKKAQRKRSKKVT